MPNGLATELPLARKYLLIAGTLAATLVATQGSAGADPKENEQDAFYLARSLDVWDKAGGWHLVNKNNSVSFTGCSEHLDALTKHHAPASIKIEIAFDTPLLPPGTYPWTQARELCDRIVSDAAKLDEIKKFVLFVHVSELDTKEYGGPKAIAYYQQCMDRYDAAMKLGVSPTEPIQDADGEPSTMQALRDAKCAPGLAKLKADEEARAAPFKKVLKNDKLRIGLRDFDFIYLPGRAKVSPASLAANNVWFEDVSGDARCTNGLPIHTLHRYQFDANHKLAKTTDRQFCGEPPSGAFR